MAPLFSIVVKPSWVNSYVTAFLVDALTVIGASSPSLTERLLNVLLSISGVASSKLESIPAFPSMFSAVLELTLSVGDWVLLFTSTDSESELSQWMISKLSKRESAISKSLIKIPKKEINKIISL